MSRRLEKISYNTKTKNLSISKADQPKQLNMNACEQTQNNITSHLESIGTLIIDELKGLERDRLKQQLLTSRISNPTTTNDLPFSSTRRNLKQVLADLHTFDCHSQREYRTIGIGDNDVNASVSRIDNEKLDVTTKRKKRQTDSLTSSQSIENETAKTPNIIPRTICTRSSKLNASNNNQEQLTHVITNRARKRRSSSINNINTSTQINNLDNTTKKFPSELSKTIGEHVSVIKVSRKKLQSSVPSVECPQPMNDF